MRKLGKQLEHVEQSIAETPTISKHPFAFIYPLEGLTGWRLEFPAYFVRPSESEDWGQVKAFKMLEYPPNCARIEWQTVQLADRARLQELCDVAKEHAETVFTIYKPDDVDADKEPIYKHGHRGTVNPFTGIGAPFWNFLESFLKNEAEPETYLEGGRGGAKSAVAATCGVLTMIRDPLANCVALRKLQNTLKNSVYNNIQTAADRLHIGKYFEPMNGTLAVHFNNPMTGFSQIFGCFGADKPAALKSITYTRGYIAFVWFEELAEHSGVKGLQNLQESFFRGLGSDNALQVSSFNPPAHGRNWVNILAKEAKEKSPRSVVRSSYLDIPYKWNGDRFHAKAEWQRKNNPAYYDWAYLGNPTDFGTVVFPESLLEVRPIKPEEIRHLPKGRGLDFGFRDPSAFIVSCYDEQTDTLFIPYEWAQAAASNRQIFKALKASPYYEDMTGFISADHEIDRVADLNKRAGTPSTMSGRMEWFGCRFRPAYKTEIVKGIRWLKARRKIVIDPRCKGLISELENYSFVETQSGGIIDDKFTCANIHTIVLDNGNAVESKDHFLDALRYSISAIMLDERTAAAGWTV